MTLEITKEEWGRFYFARHQLGFSKTALEIEQLAQMHVGLHSARIPSLPVALRSRLTDFDYKQLRILLLGSPRLLKLRCMRKTLHTVPLELAPVVHCATRSYRVSEAQNWFKRLGVESELVEKIQKEVKNLCGNSPIPYKELVDSLERVIPKNWEGGSKKEVARRLIKLSWERGDICYQDHSDSWDKEDRRFIATQKGYPGLDLNSLDSESAKRLLIQHYFYAYGPASIKDAQWWSGLSKKAVVDTLKDCGDFETKIVRIGGVDQDLFCPSSIIREIERFLSRDKNSCDWIELLAHEDSTLKAFFETRSRYVDSKYYDTLFNAIGEARASILMNGKVVGLWTFNKKAKQIECDLFEKLDAEMTNILNERVESMQDFLVGQKQNTLALEY